MVDLFYISYNLYLFNISKHPVIVELFENDINFFLRLKKTVGNFITYFNSLLVYIVYGGHIYVVKNSTFFSKY